MKIRNKKEKIKRCSRYLLILAVIFVFFTTCEDPGIGSGTVLTINLGGNSKAATGFQNAVDSNDLVFDVTVINTFNNETQTVTVKPSGSTLTINNINHGNTYDILIEAAVFGGWPYAKGEIKNYYIVKGDNTASVEMKRLFNAIALKGVDKGEELGFPPAERSGASPASKIIQIWNFSGTDNLTVTVNLPVSDGFSPLTVSVLTIPKDGYQSISIDPVTPTAGVYRPTLTVSTSGFNESFPLEYIVYPPNGLITTAAQLDAIRGNPSGNYILGADIDLDVLPPVDGSNWMPISNFSGTFDGGGFNISNMKTNRPGSGRQGFIGVLASSGIVKNVALINADITGANHTAGIVGNSYGGSRIENCYVSGTITGTSEVGGIVGYNDGVIINCYSIVNVSGTNSAGGIAGYTRNGGITNSVSLGLSVTRTSGAINTLGRVDGNKIGSGSNNYARADMLFYSSPASPGTAIFPNHAASLNGKDGADIYAGNLTAAQNLINAIHDAHGTTPPDLGIMLSLISLP